MLPRILFLLLMLISGVSSASLLSQHTLPAQYMQTTEDAAIWAQVGNSVINVGNVRAGRDPGRCARGGGLLRISLWFWHGFYRQGTPEPVQGKQRVEDSLGDLNKPLSNQNLITRKDTPVYNAPSSGSAPFGTLSANLRYPILNKLKDRLNQTWFQIRIGNRLAWISSPTRRKITDFRF